MLSTTETLQRQRLHATIAAVCPIVGVSVPTIGDSGSVRIDFDPSATAPQQTAANAALTAFDWSESALTAWINETARTVGSAAIDSDGTSVWKAFRAQAGLTIDELNTLRQWLMSFKAAVAAATNLADLKTRVAALPNLPDRTLAQAKTAIQNTIATGTVD